jgi:hypothetical protein
MQHSHRTNLFNSENQTKAFSYTIFPVKKIKCWKNLKLCENSYLFFPSYLHPDIGKFSGFDSTQASGVVA